MIDLSCSTFFTAHNNGSITMLIKINTQSEVYNHYKRVIILLINKLFFHYQCNALIKLNLKIK